jgi:hypothetical protein
MTIHWGHKRGREGDFAQQNHLPFPFLIHNNLSSRMKRSVMRDPLALSQHLMCKKNCIKAQDHMHKYVEKGRAKEEEMAILFSKIAILSSL